MGWLQVVDDAVKIGLGALIGGGCVYLQTRANARREADKERASTTVSMIREIAVSDSHPSDPPDSSAPVVAIVSGRSVSVGFVPGCENPVDGGPYPVAGGVAWYAGHEQCVVAGVLMAY